MENSKKQLLKKLATSIKQQCPSVYEAVMVLGSVSRGLADEHSDLEIEFMVSELPSELERTVLIEALGGERITHYGAPLFDGSVWSIFNLEGMWVESGWQKADTAQKFVEEIVQGKVADHDRLILASTYLEAWYLRTSTRFDEMRHSLTKYPEDLGEKIIKDTLRTWEVRLAWEVRRSLAVRGDRMPLLQRLILDCQRIMRILYALNKMWEYDYKWTQHCAEKLVIKPENLNLRLNEVLITEDCEKSLLALKTLVDDVISLIPVPLQQSSEVTVVIQNIQCV